VIAMIKRKIKKMIKKKVKNIIGHPGNKQQEAMKCMMPFLKEWKLDQGDYLEFGVWRGSSFVEAYKMADKLGIDHMKFYAFDSFEGLPGIEGRDADYEFFKDGQYSCSEKEFRQILSNNDIDMDKVIIVPGYFDQTLTDELKQKLTLKRAAIVWIDCDLYKSTIPVLNFITDYLTSGTFIVFDDWFSFGADPYAGELRAAREWLETNQNISLEYYRDYSNTGRIFLVQKW